MHLNLAAAALAAFVASASAQPPPPPPPPAASAAAAPATQYRDAVRLVETWLQAQAAYERVPGLSAGIVIGQELVWRGAFGFSDHQRKLPTRPDTIYGICSISKLFTAVAVMQLVEDGKLALDDDIAKLLPAFAMQRSDADSGPITIRMLLMHASGLPREGATSYWTLPDFRFPSREALLKGLAEQKTFMRAGDHFQYSNLGMALLGEAVAAASGTSYEAFVQDRILNPLRLADTRPYLPAAEWGKRLAQGFGAVQRDGTRQPLPLYDTRGLTPAAGFSSTVDDLARFAAWNFRLRKNGGKELLRVASLREMQRVQWTDPDGKETWGLGFAVWRDGSTALAGHGGVCPGQLRNLQMALNEEVAAIAMVNANDNRGLGRYTTPMRKLMLKGLKLPVAPADGPKLDDYAGRYSEQPCDSEVVITPWGRDLAVLHLPHTDPAAGLTLMRHAGGDLFRELREDGTLADEVTFVRDAAGRVVGYRVWNQFWPRVPGG